jgi:hypothetical protein
MIRQLISALFLVAIVGPGIARAVTDEDFQAKTSQNLLNLCTVPASDPRAQEAIHFCHGYLIGAYHYHIAETAGPDIAKRLVCIPASGVTRNEALAMFVDWAKARPQYMNESPVDTEFRFLIEKWPCKK